MEISCVACGARGEHQCQALGYSGECSAAHSPVSLSLHSAGEAAPGTLVKCMHMCKFILHGAGVANLRPAGQNQPDKDPNLVRWTGKCEHGYKFWTFNSIFY